MASTAQFAATARLAVSTVSTANTGRDGTGTIVSTFVGGASGSRIERVRIKAISTTAAGVVTMFIDDGGGYDLYDETLITAITPNTTTIAFEIDLTFGSTNPLFVPNGYIIGFATTIGQAFRVTVVGADL